MCEIFHLIVLLCIACPGFCCLHAAERTPETIKFMYDVAPQRWPTHITYMSGAKTDTDGNLRVSRAFIALNLKLPAGQYRVIQSIAGFRQGDLVSAMGQIYKVESLTGDGGGQMTWKRLDRADWPKGVRSTPICITVFLAAAGHTCDSAFFSDEENRIQILTIASVKDKTPTTTAKLIVRDRSKRGVLEATVKENDILLIDGKGHKVLSIVPANEKTRVVGWVELDAVGIPEAELKRDKKAYLTPTPVKK